MKLYAFSRNLRLGVWKAERPVWRAAYPRLIYITKRLSSGGTNVQTKSLADMPGPTVLPYVGTSWIYSHFGPYTNDQMLTFAREDLLLKYGPMYKEVLGGKYLVSLHDPKQIDYVMRSVGDIPLRMVNEVNVYWRQRKPHIYKSVGLIDSTGEEWRDLRRKVAKTVLKPSITDNFFGCLSQIGDDFVRLLKEVRNAETQEISDVRNYSHSYAFEAIWSCMFGFQMGAMKSNQSDEVKNLVKCSKQIFICLASLAYSRPWWKLFPTPTYRTFCKSEEYVSNVVSRYTREVAEKIRNGDSIEDTIFARFLAIEDFDMKDINTVTVDFAAAGITTTAFFVSLFLHRLGQEPEVQKRLQQQLDLALPEKNSPITAQTVKDVPLLGATMKEGFRLSTIIPALLRILTSDIVLSGYRIPAYTPILCQTRAASLSPTYFSSPQTFIPERWLTDNTSLDEYKARLNREARSSKFLVLPFGFGPRLCVGRRLAEKEILVVIAKVLRNFTLESEGEIELENLSLISPKSPVSVKFIDR